jgi:hypothetical protein
MSTTTTFEDEVRAMLARRSADIDPAALDARPRDGVRIALVDERPIRRGPVRWLTAAAVVAVLAAGALVLRDGPAAETATAPVTTTDATAPGRSSSTAVIPGLPAGIGVAHLLPLWDAGAAEADLEPVEVADRYLADRIGVTATALATTVPPTDEDLVTVTWGDGAGWTTPLGSVHLERRDGRWQVIAATAPDTFDLAGARLADGRLQGVVANRGTLRWGAEIGPADLTASVGGLAGLVLGRSSDCPSSPCEPETGIYIAMPDLAAAGGSTLPVELAPIGEPLAPVPHRLQAVAVRPDVGAIGEEDPQATAVAVFTEIVVDPTVPPVEPGSDTPSALPEHLASLPLGIDPTVGPVRTIEAWGAVPEAAAEDLAVEAFGGLDRVTAFTPLAIEGADPDGLWAAQYASVVPLDPAAWPGDHDDGVRGTVIVRRTDTGGWTAVAATSDALDLTGVRYDVADGGLRGEVRAAVPAPLRVTVSTVEGEVLATSDLTTFEGSDPGPSVLDLGDLLEVTDGRPVLLRVTLGDRPGQVGLDGVGVAAFAGVVLPGWSDDGGGVPSTTTG